MHLFLQSRLVDDLYRKTILYGIGYKIPVKIKLFGRVAEFKVGIPALFRYGCTSKGKEKSMLKDCLHLSRQESVLAPVPFIYEGYYILPAHDGLFELRNPLKLMIESFEFLGSELMDKRYEYPPLPAIVIITQELSKFIHRPDSLRLHHVKGIKFLIKLAFQFDSINDKKDRWVFKFL